MNNESKITRRDYFIEIIIISFAIYFFISCSRKAETIDDTSKIFETRAISPPPSRPADTLNISPDGNYIALLDEGLLTVWNLKNGTMKKIRAFGFLVHQVVFNLETNSLLTTGCDNTPVSACGPCSIAFRVWDLDSLVLLLSYEIGEADIPAVKYNKNNQIVVMALPGFDCGSVKLKLLNLTTGNSSNIIGKPFEILDYLHYPKGDYCVMEDIFAYTFGNDLSVWKVKTKIHNKPLFRQMATIRDMSFNSDCSRILTTGYNLILWDAKSGQSIRESKLGNEDEIINSTSQNTSKFVTYNINDKLIRMWNENSLNLENTINIENYTNTFEDIIYFDKINAIVVASPETTSGARILQFINIDDGKLQFTILLFPEEGYLLYTPSGQYDLVSNVKESIYDRRTEKYLVHFLDWDSYYPGLYWRLIDKQPL